MLWYVLAMAVEPGMYDRQDGPLDVKRQKQLDWNDINKVFSPGKQDLRHSCPWSKLHNSQILSEAAIRDEGTYSNGVYCGVDQSFGLWQR